MDKIFVSGSPHIQTNNSVSKMMYHVVIALLPALLVSFYIFGISAIITTVVTILSCLFFEFVIQKYVLKCEVTINDGSAVLTGLLLALNFPSGLPIWIVIFGSLVAIGIAKMSFGGLGANIFNPALVARVFLLISFPVQMTKWPIAIENRIKITDATTGATPLGFIKEGMRETNANIIDLLNEVPNYTDMFFGFIGGSLGEVSALALIFGGIYLLWKRVITWQIPTSMLLTIVLFSSILWIIDPTQYTDPLFQLLTGGVLLGAFFMATDLVTSPMNKKGQIVFGIGVGLLTMLIRYFGSYPEGVSFAILIMNAFVPLIDKYFKPKRFGV